jgi:electron transfer flavoprotein alpha subunit/electron transfer flavoprotein alpha/beta subunit
VKILVCFKAGPEFEQVVDDDWEGFSLESDLSYVKRVFGCFDETALETAPRLAGALRERGRHAECAALTLGPLPSPLLRTLFAVGFDRVRALPPDTGGLPWEFHPEETAAALEAVIAGGGWDLILAGQQAGYADTGMVPLILAERLGLPAITGAELVSIPEDSAADILIERSGENGRERLGVRLPAMAIMGNSPVAALRAATLAAQMKAAGRQAEWLSVKAPPGAAPALIRDVARKDCRFFAGAEDLAREWGDFARSAAPRSRAGGLPEFAAFIRGGGARKVWVPGASDLDRLEERWGEERPDFALFPAAWSEAAIRLCARLGCSCFPGVTSLRREGPLLLGRKKVCGSNLDWEFPIEPPAALVFSGRGFSLEDAGLNRADRRPPWLVSRETLDPPSANPLENARLVFAAGRGLGSKLACGRLERIAARYGAVLGFSRPAALNGWGAISRIIGQSGIKIQAEFCLAAGVSGAAAFMAGLNPGARLVAVNPDRNAPIFRYADAGLVMSAGEFMDVFEG